MTNEQRITEDWLRSVGFKWHQFDRQPEKQWVLWLGGALREPDGSRGMFCGTEDLGVELAYNSMFDHWYCWIRCDSSHRYHRFIHIRHMREQSDLIRLIEALTGQQWRPENNIYGAMQTPEVAARMMAESERLDRRIHAMQHPWTEHEKDGDRCRPEIQHVDAAIKGGLAR